MFTIQAESKQHMFRVTASNMVKSAISQILTGIDFSVCTLLTHCETGGLLFEWLAYIYLSHLFRASWVTTRSKSHTNPTLSGKF